MKWYWTVLNNYVGFEGRASRSEYWYFFLINTLILLVLFGLNSLMKIFIVLYAFYALATFLPSLAVGTRRLHDVGKSGFWLLFGIVPILGGLTLLYFLTQPSQPKKNQYGSKPK